MRHLRRDGEAAAQRLRRHVTAATGARECLETWIDEILSFAFEPRRAVRLAVLGSDAARRATGYEEPGVWRSHGRRRWNTSCASVFLRSESARRPAERASPFQAPDDRSEDPHYSRRVPAYLATPAGERPWPGSV